MFCKSCGKPLNSGDMFCENCGAKVTNQGNVNISQNINTTEPIVNNQYQQNNNTIGQPNNQNPKKDGKLTASLILGIISVVLSLWLSLLTLPAAIVGLILGLISKEKGGKKVASIILNVIGIIIPIAMIIIGVIAVISVGNSIENEIENLYSESTYSGDGYTLTYDYNWTVETNSDGKDVLKYYLTDTYLTPIGKSHYNQKYTCNFETISCQTEVYDDFFEFWEADLEKEELNLYEDSYSFNTLTDDAYLAIFEYGETSYELNGKLYLVVSEEKNIVLSFLSNSDSYNVETLNYAVKDLLESIEIEDASNVIYDDEMYETLDEMRDWNRYSELRSGTLGKEVNINGGWRRLSTSEEYWEFKDGEFWWYKSVNDLEDNYWYGTTKIEKGKEGLKSLGLDENRVDTIVSQSNGKVTADDIYAITFTPKKIISDGEDKSETNIKEDETWTYVWVLVDHGEEGIEGQTINTKTSETSYYVKIKD